MANLNDHTQRIVTATQAALDAALAGDDYPEAKRVLADGLRDLRDYKRQLTEAERNIRAQAADARLKNRGAGQTVGLFLGGKGRSALAKGRAAGSRNIAAQQQNALAPYANAKVTVDRAIAALDRAKASVTDDAAKAKASGATAPAAARAPKAVEAVEVSAPPTAPPPPPTPATWGPDPYGRHEHRWWDGTKWTEHVANAGVGSVDPI